MTLLLVIIYIVFISLGLPDSLLGAAWPVMHKDLGVDVSLASVISMMNLVLTSFVSFFSGKYIRKYGTLKVTLVSIVCTILGMAGIAISPNIFTIMFFSGVIGLGGGAIDTALNSYVAKYYSTRHMNWLHAFWGVGVSTSPLILSLFLKEGNWRLGYIAISLVQSLIFAFVFWKRGQWSIIKEDFSPVKEDKKLSLAQILKMPGIRLSIFTAGLYSSIEFTVGTWCASYLVFSLRFHPDVAARFVSVYFAGIMIGRILAGFVSERIKNDTLIKLGAAIALFGMLLMMFGSYYVTIAALFLLGLGYGPIYPSQLHRIPDFFGKTYAADIIGFHMAGAYAMGLLAQVSIGYIASRTSFAIIPYMLAVLCTLLLVLNKRLLSIIAKKKREKEETLAVEIQDQ